MTYYTECDIIYNCIYLQATVAAFAASEGQGHPRVVELEKVRFK